MGQNRSFAIWTDTNSLFFKSEVRSAPADLRFRMVFWRYSSHIFVIQTKFFTNVNRCSLQIPCFLIAAMCFLVPYPTCSSNPYCGNFPLFFFFIFFRFFLLIFLSLLPLETRGEVFRNLNFSSPRKRVGGFGGCPLADIAFMFR